MTVSANLLKRFIVYMAILTFVMFTVWALVRSFMNRPPGDYETEVCDMRLKDKLYDQAIQAANTALGKTPNHRGAIMCKALVFISQKMYLSLSFVDISLSHSHKITAGISSIQANCHPDPLRIS